MVKKFTVSVPDDLAEKIDQWKSTFSISGVFQKAMAEEIEKKEGFKKRMSEESNMDAIIERLRQEKQQFDNQYNVKGADAGFDWAKAASYNDLLYAVHIFNPYAGSDDNSGMNSRTIFSDEILGYYFNETFLDMAEHEKDFGFDWTTDDIPLVAQSWILGWWTAVQTFWSQIESKVES